MNSRRIIHQENNEFQILRQIEGNPDVTQRQLSEKLNISLGSVNYALNALIAKGSVKIHNFRNNQNKWVYAYFLTPRGFAEKTALMGAFLKRKMQEYQSLKEEIEALSREFVEAEESGFEDARKGIKDDVSHG